MLLAPNKSDVLTPYAEINGKIPANKSGMFRYAYIS